MTDYVSDTHGLVWYLEDDPRLGPQARAAFEACDRAESVIFVPTICLVELIYLQEKGRLPADLRARFLAELQAGASGLQLVGLTLEVAEAVAHVSRAAVPDLPDRIIAATALHLGLPLLSRDRKIQLATLNTLW